MDTAGESGGAQLAQHGAEPSSRHPLLNRMQNIEIRGKKSTIRLNFGVSEEEESGKDEDPPNPAKKPKSEWKHGDRVRKPKKARANASHNCSPALTPSSYCALPAVPCCASIQKTCTKCGEQTPPKEMHGRYCRDCYEKQHPRKNHLKKEEACNDEMRVEHFLTPETPSSSHFSSTASSSSSSAAATEHSSSHGKVCNAHICPSQMLLLTNLYVFLFAPFWFFCPPTAAIVGEMQT